MPIQFLSLQGTGGTAVPYERRNAPFATTIALNPQDSLRLKRYEEHWRFYAGIHWNFQREDGEPLVTLNYCHAIVNKKASWLIGKGMVITTPDAFCEITKPILEEVWDYNDKAVTLFNMAVTGGVTGDCFVLVTYEAPSARQKAINPHTRGKIRIRLLGSQQVFPIWNPLNMDELLSLRIYTEVHDPAARLPADVRTSPMMPGTVGVQQTRRYIEDITADTITEGWEGSTFTTRPNDLGEIPLVHIKNESFPNEYYGFSDLEGIIDVQREFNEKMTDLSDIVNYHAHPVTVIIGAKARNLEKGPKAMWALPVKDAQVFSLELGGDLAASHKYLEKVQQIMFDLGGIPEGSLGRIQSISNTSAAALQVQFQPLIEATERKAPNYERGIEKINYFILRYHELANRERLPVDLCKHCGGRIIEFRETAEDGRQITRKKCYLVNPQTLELLHPDDVKVNVKRKHSFGTETRMIPFARAKKEFLQQSASYWDPAPMKDLQKEAEEKAKQAEQKQQEAQAQSLQQQEAGNEAEFQRNQQAAEADHQRALELQKAKPQPKPGKNNG